MGNIHILMWDESSSLYTCCWLYVITVRCLRGSDNDNTYYNTLSGEQGYRLSMTDDDWVEFGQHQLW